MTPRTYTHPDVFTVGPVQGWAEAETDPTRINWAERQARAAIPFRIVGGRPVNPCENTAVRHGRNEMEFWGENLMADALVTAVSESCRPTRFLLMIERGDGYGWAVPGGHVEPGESPIVAAIRELREETGLTGAIPVPYAGYPMQPRYVPDPRSSDEAWAVTVPLHVSLGFREELPPVAGGDDARRAEWVPATTFGVLAGTLLGRHDAPVFAAHVAMLTDFLDGRLK